MEAVFRNWIDLLEQGKDRRRPMSRSHKPFTQVTKEDVVRAFFDIDDLSAFMENQWGQIDFGEDDNGEPNEPPLPRSSADLTPSQVASVIQWYSGDQTQTNSWVAVWKEFRPISQMPLIPVTRRLNRLSDLNQSLGIHWSYGNEPWDGMEGYGPHIAFAVVKNSDVDWICTAARAINSWDVEGEISVLPGAQLELRKIVFGEGTLIKS